MTLGSRKASLMPMAFGGSTIAFPDSAAASMASFCFAAAARVSSVSMPMSVGVLGTQVKFTTLHTPLSTIGITMAMRQSNDEFKIQAPAMAATMSPVYWWHVQRPNTRPRPFFGYQFPMIAVFTGPPVAWKNPWKNCVPANHARVMLPAFTPDTPGINDPEVMRSRHREEPSKPMPTTPEGEKRSPKGPVMKEPRAYVNMKAESIAASV
mmetsp:Transcript_47454/g.80984  ORF Transcript_47454/g.80984 Transcript_47454/m.80984 type:complete len:209 (-) Transcript_47454:196-822(-)